MSELGSDRFSLDECQFDRKLVMLAVDSSPESRGAVRWAAQSLLGPGDEVLIFHAIKVLKEIPTAIGMVPFSGANAEMQRAHVQVAEEEANKMAAAHAAYCKSLQIETRTEVLWGQRRQAILDKVSEGAVTHLVMGTGKSGRRLSFLRKESLTAMISREAQCQVFLVDKNGRLVSRSSYNPTDGRARPKRLFGSASAPDRLAELDAEHSPSPSYAPSPNVRTSGSISSASSTLYAASEVDETDNSSAPGSPFPPFFRATAGTPPRSPVTVLVKDCAVRTSPLQRTVSMPSPLAKEGTAHKGKSGGLPMAAAAPPLSHSPNPPFKTKHSYLEESAGPFSDWERGTSPGPPSPDPSAGHVAFSPRPESQRRGRGADADVSRAGTDASQAEGDVSGETELEALRAQVRELRLVSAMRAREAERYAKRLEATQTEADAVARQLAEESRRRKAAERAASQLVTILGATAPDKVVDILTARSAET